MSDVPSKSQFLIYQSDDGTVKIDVRFENETVWLTQPLIAELFQTSVPNVSMHLKNIFEEGELGHEATVKDFLTVRLEGTRQVSRSLEFYKLDAFLTINDREILAHAGTISHELALAHAEQHYDTFHRRRLAENAQLPDDFEKAIQRLPALAKPKRKEKSRNNTSQRTHPRRVCKH